MSRSPSAGSTSNLDHGGYTSHPDAGDDTSFQPLEASAVPVTQLLSTLGIEASADGEGIAATDSPRVNASHVEHPGSFLPTGTPNGLGFNTPGALVPDDMRRGSGDGEDADKCNLYVSNISTDVDDDQLRGIFAPYGSIVNSRIMVDIHTCKSRGFGFVQYSTAAEANAAVSAVDGSVHNAQTLMVRVASKKTRQPGSLLPKVFLRNVPAGVSEDELRRICSCFGDVTTCAVRPDVQHGVVTDKNTGGVSQVAYITFAELDSAKKAAASLNNSKPWDTCTNPVLAKVLDNNHKRRDDPGSQGPSPGLGPSSQNNSVHATPQLNPYSPSSGQQLQAPPPPTPPQQPPPQLGHGQTQHGMAQMPPHVLPTPGMPGSLAHPGMTANGSPFVTPNGLQPQPSMTGAYGAGAAAMPPYPGMSPYGMPYAPPMPAGPMPPSPVIGPGYAGAGPAPYPGGAVPPGYQVVMQPTLQPLYPGMPGAPPAQQQQQQHHHHHHQYHQHPQPQPQHHHHNHQPQPQSSAMGQYSPSNFSPAGVTASPPWHPQHPLTPQHTTGNAAAGSSPGLLPQR